jgi:hypothetical protein
VKKTIISTALAAITLIGVGSVNVAHADGTTPPPWDFYGVPQLGYEAVRGTGCGGDGSIGDVIPDGYWRGYLGSDNGTSIEFDLACVYFHQVANSTPVPDGWLVNNKTRTRTVAKSPGYFVSGTRYQPDGSVPFAQTATVEEGGMYDGDNIPFEGGETWLYIENGQAQWLVGAPVTSAAVAANNPAPAPATDPALIPPGVIEDGVHFGYAVNATNTSISFDRADLQADGLWTNNNPKVRTLPVTADFWSSNLFPYPGQPIEIHVQGQRVTLLTEAMPYDDDYCGC